VVVKKYNLAFRFNEVKALILQGRLSAEVLNDLELFQNRILKLFQSDFLSWCKNQIECRSLKEYFAHFAKIGSDMKPENYLYGERGWILNDP
jgi:hypothetical protein